ncbi:MAG: hypothetical protein VKJ64_10445 [Leptolyngbyaceae bacterium]|nr:hypothetical protein [Leptolyngbyaceae bacterium]
MNPSHDSSPNPDNTVPDLTPSGQTPSDQTVANLGQALNALEDGVAVLRQRYDSVIQAQSEKQEVRVRINRAQSELRQHRTKQVEEELNSLQNKLEEIELTLESQLFSWSSLKEPFWQIVRFGGVGIVIGWVLRSLM